MLKTPGLTSSAARVSVARVLLRQRLRWFVAVALALQALLLGLVAGAIHRFFAGTGELASGLLFALFAIVVTGIGTLVVQRRIATVAAEFDRLTIRLASAADTLGQRTTELEAIRGELEMRVGLRTRELAEAQARLVEAAHRAGQALVAQEILHNVGNVLTSLNVSTDLLRDRLGESAIDRVTALAERAAADPAARERLPANLRMLGAVLAQEQAANLTAVAGLHRHLDHVAHIVRAQQGHADAEGLVAAIDMPALVADAVHIAGAGQDRTPRIETQVPGFPGLRSDPHRLLQILVNLLVNAHHALAGVDQPHIRIIAEAQAGRVRIRIEDNGCGIAADDLPRLLDLGFTTRGDGHGVGLHVSAVAARQLGGGIHAASPGPGLGAAFCVELPLAPPSATTSGDGR